MNLRSLSTRRAFTMIELLVVIAILLMITAAAIPIMAPAMSNRKMREAARITSTYFAAARARAIESGRPVGVFVERFVFPGTTPGANDVRYSLVLSMIEVPEPWAGDFVDSRIAVDANGCIRNFVFSGEGGWPRVKPGDLVRVGSGSRLFHVYAGEAYRDLDGDRNYTSGEPYVDADRDGQYTGPIAGMVDTSTGYFAMPPNFAADPKQLWTLGCLDPGAPLHPSLGTIPNPTNFSDASNAQPRSFQFIRQPTLSAVPPVQLPDDCIIDLEQSGASGIPGWDTSFDNAPAVVFAPNGSVSAIYDGAQISRPLGPIYFLVGRRDLMRDVTPNSQDQNLGNDPLQANVGLKNLWVAIGHQTGTITTSEMGTDFDGSGSISVFESRYYAQQAQGMGGR